MAQLTVKNKIGKVTQLGVWLYDATTRRWSKNPFFRFPENVKK